MEQFHSGEKNLSLEEELMEEMEGKEETLS
jgi:hypothetical protein